MAARVYFRLREQMHDRWPNPVADKPDKRVDE